MGFKQHQPAALPGVLPLHPTQTLTQFFKLLGISRGDIFMSLDRRPINSTEIKDIVKVGTDRVSSNLVRLIISYL